MNYNSLQNDIRNIKELSVYDPEAAASRELDLLYDFVNFIVSAFSGSVLDAHYLKIWATEIRKVKDMEFRRD